MLLCIKICCSNVKETHHSFHREIEVSKGEIDISQLITTSKTMQNYDGANLYEGMIYSLTVEYS